MLSQATPAIAAQVDRYEKRERDTLRSTARQQLGSPARAGARIALAICEVEAGLRPPLQLERFCHLTVWPKLSARLRRSGGPAVPVRSLVRVVAQEHTPEPPAGRPEHPIIGRSDSAIRPPGSPEGLTHSGNLWNGGGSLKFRSVLAIGFGVLGGLLVGWWRRFCCLDVGTRGCA